MVSRTALLAYMLVLYEGWKSKREKSVTFLSSREIDWEKKSLALTSINQDGKKLVEHQVAFSELEFGE